jgi:hypothetical protein
VLIPAGTRGTIVEANPKYGVYTVEISDDDGRTLDLVPARARDLAPPQRRSY